MTAALDYQYESEVYDGIDNDPNLVRPPKRLVDARLVVDTPYSWNIAIWGKNLTNEIYRTHQFYLLGGQFATYGPPRTFGATVTWKY